jgi:hypothetical protein
MLKGNCSFEELDINVKVLEEELKLLGTQFISKRYIGTQLIVTQKYYKIPILSHKILVIHFYS